MRLAFRQVDVFARRPLAGNGLAVIRTDEPLEAALMQELTRELRQFETIFLTPSANPGCFCARVFTMDEELAFAGHPAIGAAAVLHEAFGGDHFDLRLALPSRIIPLTSKLEGENYEVAMNQGAALFGDEIPFRDQSEWLSCFGLGHEHVGVGIPMTIASTGLPYLIVPVTAEGLERARISVPDLEQRLAAVGAKFVYLFDTKNREGRTWDNRGLTEDIATGSAAGPVAALLVRHGLARAGEDILLRQGRFTGRASEMKVRLIGSRDQDQSEVMLEGSVVMVARGEFDARVVRGLGLPS